MKYLVTAKPGPMPPPIDLVRQAQEWIQARLDDGTFEACYAFPQGAVAASATTTRPSSSWSS